VTPPRPICRCRQVPWRDERERFIANNALEIDRLLLQLPACESIIRVALMMSAARMPSCAEYLTALREWFSCVARLGIEHELKCVIRDCR
jgi:hypothetical protein